MKIKCLTLAMLLAISTQVNAQGPGGGGGRGGQGGPGGQVGQGGQGGGENPIARLMALDKNSDGKLTEDEYTDSRLKPLLERADADKNKVITREELTAQMQREGQGGGQGGPGQGGPGGPGGMGEGGRGGGREGGGGGGDFGGRGGRGGGMRGMMMRPGTVLPDFMVQELKLSEEQRSQLAKLQATVDAELAKILNQNQQNQLKQLGERRPEGGRGGFEGGPGQGGFGPGGPGPGGPGGPPGGPGANNDFQPGEGRPKT